jgi:hypothetical protein
VQDFSMLLGADPVLSKFRTLLLAFIAVFFLLVGTLGIALDTSGDPSWIDRNQLMAVGDHWV